MTQHTRRAFGLGLLATTGVAACGNGIGSNGAAKIDARVDTTLDFMFQNFPGSLGLAQKSAGMLVMPIVTKIGLGLGGGFGRGALQVSGVTVDYYSAASASAGIQLGAQQSAHVLFFMTENALQDFRLSPGWAVGANVEYALQNVGDTIQTDTNTASRPVVAVVFGQAGFRLGATLDGTKYTRIIP